MSDFVTFEIAKKLKEKGFPQRPDYFNYSSYYEWDGLRKIHPLSNASVWFDPNISRDNLYFAPKISQVLKWIREEKKIDVLPHRGHISIDKNSKVTRYYNVNIYFERSFACTLDNSEQDYFTYEQAALAGIEYVLDNLI